MVAISVQRLAAAPHEASIAALRINASSQGNRIHPWMQLPYRRFLAGFF
jgi:hypothetical protein